ncbi:glycosyltransferase family 2 protein [Parasediminibacterium sp. JCM 36343]|uniref:glycosyltransferase family 2 protein n=1 Tax=Parasediminibacterium sp. JCM 36343 TaxID=3374279 RepID=UPI0039794744
MPNSYFSFIILTYNEEFHLPRLLSSIQSLYAATYILDSGSTDGTVVIANGFGCTVKTNAFVNHPKQWHAALAAFNIQTPWVVCLDADHTASPELVALLAGFTGKGFEDVNGIYFNRKNIFKGKWLRHGGYSPFYLLKMIRFGVGYSDLNENMDHRFVVPGKTVIWKEGYLIEENFKENHIAFWISKHNRYSDLVAAEEWERMLKMRSQTIKPNLLGNPDEKKAFLKSIWWKMPLYVRPFIYFFHRYFIQLGILDGKQGFVFHFLQAFWFRLVVDIKIDELKKGQKQS